MSTLHNEALAYLAMTIFNGLAPPHVQYPVTKFTGLWSSALSTAPNVKRGTVIDERTMTVIANALMTDPRVRREIAKIPMSYFDGV